MNNNFSENLKKIRKDNNLSQEQLADELGVSRQAISKWESAVAYPEMDKIIALCTKFHLNIDDLLYKDIREVKGEETVKKNINNFIYNFLNFITNTINLFCNMNFKSKIKCLFEQFVIGFVLFIIFLLIGCIIGDLLSGIFGLIPEKIYFVFRSIIDFIYIIFSIAVSLMIMLHIFKTRYLDYYEKIKNSSMEETSKEQEEIIEEKKDNDDRTEIKEKADKIDKKNKILFKKNESKIIIRDPKHSEYKFFDGIIKIIIGFIKFFALCFAITLFILLLGIVFCFVVSFLIYKTGFVFIGLLILLFALAVINIDCILMTLNFIFNRKNDKKKIIWSIIISFILLGIGCGITSIGALKFEYIGNDKSQLKTDYIEFKMTDDLFFNSYYNLTDIEYVESDIDNIKVEYQINNFCDINYSDYSENGIHLWVECSNSIKLVNKIIEEVNSKRIITISSNFESIKVFASKSNIEKMKMNRDIYYEKARQEEINSYENRIAELEEQNQEYFNQINEYEQEIANLEAELFEYQLEE